MSTQTCTQIFIAASFVIARTRKHGPRCPSGGDWINKLWDIQTMGHYSVLKGNGLSSHEKTWRELQGVLPRERSQSENHTLYDSKHMAFWKRRNYGNGRKNSGCQGFGEREGWLEGPIVANVPRWWGMFPGWESVRVWGQGYMGTMHPFPSILLWTLNLRSKKFKSFFKKVFFQLCNTISALM